MDARIILNIVRATICPLVEWLELQAKHSDNPVDDRVVAILKLLLCDGGEK